jgi:hypothetical protein
MTDPQIIPRITRAPSVPAVVLLTPEPLSTPRSKTAVRCDRVEPRRAAVRRVTERPPRVASGGVFL